MLAKYIGKSRNELINGKMYDITIKKPIKSYVYDICIGDCLIMNCASQKSIRMYWEFEEEINVDE